MGGGKAKMEDIVKEYEHIEEEFFDIDKEKKIAYIKLHFGKPSDIFDNNYISKRPVLSDDFLDWVNSAFTLIPKKYKIDLDVTFDDTEGYASKELADVFKMNVFLDYKTRKSAEKKKNNIAYGLIFIGTLLFAAMITVNRLWTTDSVFKDIVSYVMDIATTVTYWEAMGILIVENKEHRDYRKGLITRFYAISFHGVGGEKAEFSPDIL